MLRVRSLGSLTMLDAVMAQALIMFVHSFSQEKIITIVTAVCYCAYPPRGFAW